MSWQWNPFLKQEEIEAALTKATNLGVSVYFDGTKPVFRKGVGLMALENAPPDKRGALGKEDANRLSDVQLTFQKLGEVDAIAKVLRNSDRLGYDVQFALLNGSPTLFLFDRRLPYQRDAESSGVAERTDFLQEGARIEVLGAGREGALLSWFSPSPLIPAGSTYALPNRKTDG